MMRRKSKYVEGLLAGVKKELNAGSAVLIVCDSEMPCPDERSEEGCRGHRHHIYSDGVHAHYVPGIIQNVTELGERFGLAPRFFTLFNEPTHDCKCDTE